ncbi:uncharacterized protein LOC124695773 [Lolium rigidum]|uniref:uncharacterized protein LOC124695773 n=1 Tax=Lolium rigidum TaxID=89674 RepID=UPI001F5E13CE|nr:uncharacterized protein LOC124695773 [Lolium rigidum]
MAREKHFKEFSLDITPDAGFAARYRTLLREIAAYLKSVAQFEMENTGKKHRKPVTLSGRAYTPDQGVILVRLYGPSGSVYLLMRMYDLYMESFYVDGIWFRLNDATAPLPPTSQLPYGPKKKDESDKDYLTKTGVIKLSWGTSYLEVPGNVTLYRKSFRKAYNALRNALAKVLAGTAWRDIGPYFKFFAVVISEGLRFPDCERWVVWGMLFYGAIARPPPAWLNELFSQWRKRSCRMYLVDPPMILIKSIRVVKRMPDLHSELKQTIQYHKKGRVLSDAIDAAHLGLLEASDNMTCVNDSKPLHLELDIYNYNDGDGAADAAAAAAAAAAPAPPAPADSTLASSAPADAPLTPPAPADVAAGSPLLKDANAAADHTAPKDVPSSVWPLDAAPDAPAEADSVPSIARCGPAREVKCDPSMYPQRPGKSACHSFLKNGYCDFAAKCKFHHPVDSSAPNLPPFNRHGFPKREGIEVCKMYIKDGTCRHGSKCRFNHPSPRKKTKRQKEDELPPQAGARPESASPGSPRQQDFGEALG